MINHDHIHTFAVDADIVAYRCAAVCEENNTKTLFLALDEFLFNIARETGIKKMCLFLSNSTNFRYDIAKTKPYKGNRNKCKHDLKKGCRLNEAECTHKVDFKSCPEYEPVITRPRHINVAKEYLTDMYGAIIRDNYEADDCIASYMTQHECVAHAGIDKDIRQIWGWHYDFVKRIWEYTSEEESALKLYRQVCMGDSSDNIPGLPGIGEKKAAGIVTDQYRARDQAFAAYKKIMFKLGKEGVAEYFEEQYALVTMVDSLDIPYEHYVVIDPPAMFEKQEGGWTGEEQEDVRIERPKLEID